MMETPASHAAALAALLLRAKAQIVTDILDYRVGRGDAHKITSYGDLHDYVDANYYGGAFEEGVSAALIALLPGVTEDDDPFAECVNQFFGPMQYAVDDWIKAGGLTGAVEGARVGRLRADLLRAIAAGLPITGVTL